MKIRQLTHDQVPFARYPTCGVATRERCFLAEGGYGDGCIHQYV
jgi:hypothetical protein